MMVLSRSLGRKIVATGTAAVAFAFLYEITILDSRYAARQAEVGECYRDTRRWTRMSILNAARTGKFSSDRTIHEYCRDIWQVKPVPIEM